MLSLIVHADWSIGTAKRRMAWARRQPSGHWLAYPPEPVGDTSTLLERLLLRAGDGVLLAGFDFPIGLPRAYAQRAGLDRFGEALRRFGSGVWADFYRAAETPDQISLHRPFYPNRAWLPQAARSLSADRQGYRQGYRPIARLVEGWILGQAAVG